MTIAAFLVFLMCFEINSYVVSRQYWYTVNLTSVVPLTERWVYFPLTVDLDYAVYLPH